MPLGRREFGRGLRSRCPRKPARCGQPGGRTDSAVPGFRHLREPILYLKSSSSTALASRSRWASNSAMRRFMSGMSMRALRKKPYPSAARRKRVKAIASQAISAPDVPADCSTGPIAVNGWIPASSSVARRRRMKKSRALAVTLGGLVLVATAALHASDLIAVYARVDRVVLAPNAESPQTIQVFGVFSVAVPANPNDYQPPAR